jgi:hypothetical protein
MYSLVVLDGMGLDVVVVLLGGGLDVVLDMAGGKELVVVVVVVVVMGSVVDDGTLEVVVVLSVVGLLVLESLVVVLESVVVLAMATQGRRTRRTQWSARAVIWSSAPGGVRSGDGKAAEEEERAQQERDGEVLNIVSPAFTKGLARG